MQKSALDRALKELVSRDVDAKGEKDDFDSRVAALIVQEAREKNNGISKGIPSIHSSEPRKHTNTRFLNNVIRGVQSHNRAVLNASSSADKIIDRNRSDRCEEDRKQGRQNRSVNGDEPHSSRTDKVRRRSEDERKIKIERGNYNYDVQTSSGRKYCNDSTSSASDEREEGKRKRKHKERSDRDKGKRRKYDDDDDSRGTSKHGKDILERQSSESSISSRKKEDLPSTSKMDRYFAKNYDPMMDVKAEVRQNESGLIEDDGWDRMLKALKEKEEKKRARKEMIRMKEKKSIDRSNRIDSNLLNAQYAGRGAQREWDKGKPSIE